MSRVICKWIDPELDSRFRGDDITRERFSVMLALRLHAGQAPVGIEEFRCGGSMPTESV